MRPVTKALVVAVFAAFGLAGPLLRLAVPTTTGNEGVDSFVYELVLLLWPAQVLGVMERTLGTVRTGLVAVGTNLLLFTVVGVVAAISARWAWASFLLQALVLGCVGWWALVWAGFDPEFLDWSVLAVAGIFYSVPFAIARRSRGSRGPSSMSELPNNKMHLTRSAHGPAERGPRR